MTENLKIKRLRGKGYFILQMELDIKENTKTVKEVKKE